jgi:hypothetical protein
VAVREEGATMLQTTSIGSHNPEPSTSQAKSSHPGRFSRLLLKLRPLWHENYGLQRPRRSIDREAQEYAPDDLF